MKKIIIILTILFTGCNTYTPDFDQQKAPKEAEQANDHTRLKERVTEEMLLNNPYGAKISILTVDGKEYILVRMPGEGLSICPKQK